MAEKQYGNKVNITGLIVLIIVTTFTIYMVFGTDFRINAVQAQIKANKSLEVKNDAKLKEHPAYLLLKAYGQKLNAVDTVDKLRDASPVWTEFLGDLSRNMPKAINISSVGYDIQTQKVVFTLKAPSREILIGGMNFLLATEGLKNIDFGTITQENITFPYEKIPRISHSSVVSFDIDSEFLSKRYELIRSVKEQIGGGENTTISNEGNMPSTQSGSNTETGSSTSSNPN